MCTVTLIKTASGYNIFMNRDERHDRSPERPPEILDATHGITAPIDPQSGGTWTAHNAKGYWGCILNGYAEAEGEPSNASQSRGIILPELLRQNNPLQAAANLTPEPFASFTLLIGSPTKHKLFAWDGTTYAERDFHASKNENKFFFTSSSWKQPEVIELRKPIFNAWAEAPSFTDKGSPTLHHSTEPELQSAIMMHRSYSRTKSITSIEVTSDSCKMSYEPITPPQTI